MGPELLSKCGRVREDRPASWIDWHTLERVERTVSEAAESYRETAGLPTRISLKLF